MLALSKPKKNSLGGIIYSKFGSNVLSFISYIYYIIEVLLFYALVLEIIRCRGGRGMELQRMGG